MSREWIVTRCERWDSALNREQSRRVRFVVEWRDETSDVPWASRKFRTAQDALRHAEELVPDKRINVHCYIDGPLPLARPLLRRFVFPAEAWTDMVEREAVPEGLTVDCMVGVAE